MNLKLLTLPVAAAILAFSAAPAGAVTTVLGGTGQSSTQGVNSGQAAENGSGGSNTFILGNSAPSLTQTSSNTLTNNQTIGGGAGTTILIGVGPNSCFCQSNSQSVNSSQVAENGDGGAGTTVIIGNSTPQLTQSSANTLANTQAIGGGGITTIIGAAAQANTQAVNSSQSADNGSGGAGLLFVGGPAGSTPALDQVSTNALSNRVILGG